MLRILVGNLHEQYPLFRHAGPAVLRIGTRTTIPVMSAILGLCLALTLVARANASSNKSAQSAPPAGFQPIAQIDLASKPCKPREKNQTWNNY